MGGSGGGGSSGEVGFPAYMETIHNDWLDQTGVDNINDSITDVMNAMLGSSPWTALSAYDPDADITAYEAAITAFAAILAGITDTTDWAALFTQADTSIGAHPTLAVADKSVADMAGVGGITEAVIVADGTAFANRLDDEITTKVLPRFEGGMRDINAVVSSAFVLGRSIIEGFRDREVAKHDSEIRLAAMHKNADIDLEEGKANLVKDVEVASMNLGKDVEVGKTNSTIEANYSNMYVSAANQMLNLMLNRINWEAAYVHTVVESKRIKIVAKKEQTDMDADIDKRDALWDAEVFQYGANLLGSIGSGVVKPDKPSLTQSVIGGAMTGAAAGGMATGTPQGAAAGAVLGAASAFL